MQTTDFSTHVLYARTFKRSYLHLSRFSSARSGQLVIPSHVSVLHVEQEVNGDDTLALQSVLESDERREELIREERDIAEKLNAANTQRSVLT